MGERMRYAKTMRTVRNVSEPSNLLIPTPITVCSECKRFERRGGSVGWCGRLNKLVFNASGCFEGIKGEGD